MSAASRRLSLVASWWLARPRPGPGPRVPRSPPDAVGAVPRSRRYAVSRRSRVCCASSCICAASRRRAARCALRATWRDSDTSWSFAVMSASICAPHRVRSRPGGGSAAGRPPTPVAIPHAKAATPTAASTPRILTGRSRGLVELLQERQRVDGAPAPVPARSSPQLEVQVASARATGVADLADRVPGLHTVTLLHQRC